MAGRDKGSRHMGSRYSQLSLTERHQIVRWRVSMRSLLEPFSPTPAVPAVYLLSEVWLYF
jgi:hypothetical protein